MREDRALPELEPVPAVLVGLHDVRADDVGRHQVGRELDAAEVEVEDLAHRLDEFGLAEAGHAFEQNVAAAEHRGQRAFDDALLADDQLADFGAAIGEHLAEIIGFVLEHFECGRTWL